MSTNAFYCVQIGYLELSSGLNQYRHANDQSDTKGVFLFVCFNLMLIILFRHFIFLGVFLDPLSCSSLWVIIDKLNGIEILSIINEYSLLLCNQNQSNVHYYYFFFGVTYVLEAGGV